MEIRGIVVSGGPIPSAIILSPAEDSGMRGELPISVGTFESSAVGMGLKGHDHPRPMTHDLMLNVIESLGATLESVSIVRVEGRTFFATLTLTDTQGETIVIDSRPSDALALAVRRHVPIFADEEVLQTASTPDFDGVRKAEQEVEMSAFHDFVENLSPEDFTANK